MRMFRRLFCAAIALLGSGCASTQLNYNTGDLANSLNSLAKKQIFFNLAQALTDPEFVPSQVTISIGTAQTANAITPSLALPLGPPIATTSRFTAGTNPNAQFSTQLTTASPSIGLQATDAWNQSWTMVPAASSNQLRRLRSPLSVRDGNAAAQRPDRRSQRGRRRAAVPVRISHAGHGGLAFTRRQRHLQAGWLPGQSAPGLRTPASFTPTRPLPKARTASCASTISTRSCFTPMSIQT